MSDWNELYERLESFKALEDGYYYNFLAPTEESISRAKKFAEMMKEAVILPPAVFPGNLGHVSFEWEFEGVIVDVDLEDVGVFFFDNRMPEDMPDSECHMSFERCIERLKVAVGVESSNNQMETDVIG